MKSAAVKKFFSNVSINNETFSTGLLTNLWRNEYKKLLIITFLFIAAYNFPAEYFTFYQPLYSAFSLARWYAREHVILCLIPAFFIAGVISVFISQAAVIKYFGAQANKYIAYLVASVSGSVLAVCSCTILPMFAGIHKRGAGLGPAVAFLYSGPAINILGIILTARILGLELGIARIAGAVIFSIVIGLIMSFIYRKEEKEKINAGIVVPEDDNARPMWQTSIHFFLLVLILVFANWGRPDSSDNLWFYIYSAKWVLTGIFSLGLVFSLLFILKLKPLLVSAAFLITLASILLVPDIPIVSFTVGAISLALLLSLSKGEGNDWMNETWSYTKQIFPLLAVGVMTAGFFLGSPEGSNGIIPNEWISAMVGGNSLLANFGASVAGAFMYFATLTEIPIVQGLMNSGMGKGPALALLLAGPALSLPSMLVIRSILGTQKTIVYIILVIVMATISGLVFGTFF